MNIGLTQRDIWRFMKVYFAPRLKTFSSRNKDCCRKQKQSHKNQGKNDSKIVVTRNLFFQNFGYRINMSQLNDSDIILLSIIFIIKI